MSTAVLIRASVALLVWLGILLGLGYFMRLGIAAIFGPDTWWLVAGWAGMMVGMIHFLAILILARQPRIEE